MATNENPDLSWLTIEDTKYISVFDDAWVNGQKADWIETKSFDKARAKKLSKDTKLSYPLATEVLQLAKINEPDTKIKSEITQSQEEIIDIFIYQSEMYGKVKDLINSDDKELQYNAILFANISPFDLYYLTPEYYRKSFRKKSIYQAVVLCLILIVALASSIYWLLIGTIAIAGVLIFDGVRTFSNNMRARQDLMDHLKGQDIDLENPERLKPEEVHDYIIHFYETEAYGSNWESIETDHDIKVPRSTVNAMAKKYGFSAATAKDMLQHYAGRHANEINTEEAYYEYFVRFDQVAALGVKGAFVSEWKHERTKISALKLYLYSAIGLVALCAGFISFFFGLDGRHGQYEKIQGIVFSLVGATYMYIYGIQIYHRRRGPK